MGGDHYRKSTAELRHNGFEPPRLRQFDSVDDTIVNIGFRNNYPKFLDASLLFIQIENHNQITI